MLHIRIHKALFFTFFLMLFGCIADLQATTYKVQTVAELKARVEAKLLPNDTVLLANGTWRSPLKKKATDGLDIGVNGTPQYFELFFTKKVKMNHLKRFIIHHL